MFLKKTNYACVKILLYKTPINPVHKMTIYTGYIQATLKG